MLGQMDNADYTPPANFSCHSVGVFRSSFPARKNFSFLKALRLKSILYLCPEEYPETNLKFCEENGINLLRFPMEGNKEPMMEVPEDIMHSALSALIDVRNHPILIHCNAGKHRTGAVSGCLRRLQGWALTSIFYEYNHFAGDKGRLADQLFIELYRPVVRVDPQFVAEWFEPHCGVTIVLDEAAVKYRGAREGHPHGSAVAAHIGKVKRTALVLRRNQKEKGYISFRWGPGPRTTVSLLDVRASIIANTAVCTVDIIEEQTLHVITRQMCDAHRRAQMASHEELLCASLPTHVRASRGSIRLLIRTRFFSR